MADGRAAEFGEPHQLLQDRTSALSGIVDETGPAARSLRDAARIAHEGRERGDDPRAIAQRVKDATQGIDVQVD
jgi:hypothetical protein